MPWGALVLAVWLLGGCTDPQHDSLRMGLASPPQNLDPRLATDATSERINRLLYRRLVEFDANSQVVPSLATWERAAPTLYRFRLGDKGRSFAHGRRLNAADVKATFESVLDPATGSPHRQLLSIIKRIAIRGSEQVDFHLTHPDAQFPAYLSIGILPADLIASGHVFRRQPIGSGAFRFVDWPGQGQLRLERRSDGRLFEFLVVKDPGVRAMKLLRGEIHMLQNDLPPELFGWLRDQEGIRVSAVRGANFTYLGFNLEDPASGQLVVRRAIAHAIDRRSIIRYVMKDAAVPAEGMFPPEHWAGIGRVRGYVHDPKVAKRLLREAGYDSDNPLRLVYKSSSDPFRIRLATILQAQLARVGVEVELRSYDWGTFYDDIKSGRFQMYSLSWVGIKTPDIFRYVFHSASVPPAGANRGRYRSARVDRLIEQASAEPEPDTQAGMYRRLQELLLEDLPYVPLWYEDQVFVCRAELAGYRLASDGNYDGLQWVRWADATDAAADG